MESRKPESFKPLTISSLEQLPASTAQAEEHASYAAQRARLLLGCYRTGDANDPETYVAAVAATLAHFPDDVITSVTHPVTGIPSRLKWLPSVSEVRMACDEAMEPIIRIQQRSERIAQQLADREAAERLRSKPRPSIDEMKAKFGPKFGLETGNDKTLDQRMAEWKPGPSIEELRQHYSRYNLAFRPKQPAE